MTVVVLERYHRATRRGVDFMLGIALGVTLVLVVLGAFQ
jgi:hypothetical protein